MVNEIYGYVYLITNKINGKQYVGKTTETIRTRFNNHYAKRKNSYIGRAINKYGKENFTHQELAVANNKKELKFLEELYISWFETLTPNGYNLMKISGGFEKHSRETKEKLKIIANKPENLKRLSENGKKRRGKPKTNSKSKYVGVTISSYNTYNARIGKNYKIIDIGSYSLESDAAKAYDIAAIKHFGNDATLNFPELREDYIKNKIIIKKNSNTSNSKSKEYKIYFHNKNNTWYYTWFDNISQKNKTKHFKTKKEAIVFKNVIILNKKL